MHMIDVAVVGHYGTAELAALAREPDPDLHLDRHRLCRAERHPRLRVARRWRRAAGRDGRHLPLRPDPRAAPRPGDQRDAGALGVRHARSGRGRAEPARAGRGGGAGDGARFPLPVPARRLVLFPRGDQPPAPGDDGQSDDAAGQRRAGLGLGRRPFRPAGAGRGRRRLCDRHDLGAGRGLHADPGLAVAARGRARRARLDEARR